MKVAFKNLKETFLLFITIITFSYTLNVNSSVINEFKTFSEPTQFITPSLSNKNSITLVQKIFFGKAYVISTLPIASKNAYAAALACGFYPSTISAIQPIGKLYNHSLELFYQKCFSQYDLPFNESKAFGLTTGEMALICSHRKVYDLISNDPSTSGDDWSLVLEDDAGLNPFFNSSEFNSKIFMSLTNLSKLNGASYGFIHNLEFIKERKKFI
jgi:hypothetical protein